MASFFKFEDFVEALCLGEHNLHTGTIKLYLSNAAPSASGDADKADLAEITQEHGYTAPVDTQNTLAETGGTATLTGTNVTITASGGTVGPFQYIVLYNDTHATDGLVGCWNYGSALTLQDGDSITTKFNNGASTGTILTVA